MSKNLTSKILLFCRIIVIGSVNKNKDYKDSN